MGLVTVPRPREIYNPFLSLAGSIKMPDVGRRERSSPIRDIVTRVHVVTVRIRDGVTRYALCTHVTRRLRRQTFPQSLPRCGGVARRLVPLCEKRAIDGAASTILIPFPDRAKMVTTFGLSFLRRRRDFPLDKRQSPVSLLNVGVVVGGRTAFASFPSVLDYSL